MFAFSNKYTKWILLFFVTVGGAIRFFGINSNSLDFEEQIFWFIGTQKSIFDSFFLILQHKPASLILGFTVWITNSNSQQIEFFSRFFSFFSGIISIPLIFFLTRKFYSEFEGIISAGFVTFSWICINISQTLSEHSILFASILLYFISLMTFLDKISEIANSKSKNSEKTENNLSENSKISTVESFSNKFDNIFLIIFGILLGISSFWGIITVGISLFYVFFFIKKSKIFIKTFFTFVSFFIPLSILAGIIIQNPNFFTSQQINKIEYFNGINYILSNIYFLSFILLIPLLFLIFVYIKFLFFPKKFGEDSKTKFSNSTLILAIWLFCGIICWICLTYSLKVKFDYFDLIFLLPPIIILISRGITLFSSKLNHQIIYCSILILLVIFSTFINFENINSKAEYDEASRYIMRKILNKNLNINQKNSAIIFTGTNSKLFSVEMNNFYLKKNRINLPIYSFNGKIQNIDSVFFEIKSKKYSTIWYICDNSLTNSEFLNAIKEKVEFSDGFSYKKLTLLEIKALKL